MSIIITIFFLIILNGFFAMSEMAIVASRKPALRNMIKKGNKSAQIVMDIIDNQSMFLSAIQVGITAISTLAAAYSGATIAEKLEDILSLIPYIEFYSESFAISIVVLVITYVSVVIGELIPKRIALRNPELIATFVARPMIKFSKLFLPFVKIFDISAEIVMKFFGIFGNNEEKVTEAEIHALINEGAETGLIEKSEYEMMRRVFLLDNRDAKSIMTHISEVAMIQISESDIQIKKKLNEAKHSRYPVIDNESSKVIGIVEAKEILSDFISTGKININKYIKTPHFISENINCLKVLEMFKNSSITIAIVIDEFGVTQGIITASDIFEAIVGIIPANYDQSDEVMIKSRDHNSWFVDGSAPIEEISIVIGIEEISSHEFDTISGFVSANVASVVEGAKFTKYGYSFEVIDIDGIKIDKILITKIM